MAAHRCSPTLLLMPVLLLLFPAVALDFAANPLPAPAAAGNKAENAYYGAIPGIPPGSFYGGGGYGGIPGGGFGGGGGGWGSGYGGGPGGGGGYAHGGVDVPTVVCQEKGPCYGKKVACPKRCFWSYSRSGNGYGAGAGGGSCTVDCKSKCTATC